MILGATGTEFVGLPSSIDQGPNTKLWSEPLIQILLPNNGHDFHGFALNPIIDAVDSAHATPVPGSDVVHGWI